MVRGVVTVIPKFQESFKYREYMITTFLVALRKASTGADQFQLYI